MARRPRSSYLAVAVGGGDVERGEAVEERGPAEQGGAGAQGGGEVGEVARLRGAEEVHLLAGAAAAGAVPHRRRPRPSLRRAGGEGRAGLADGTVLGEHGGVESSLKYCAHFPVVFKGFAPPSLIEKVFFFRRPSKN